MLYVTKPTLPNFLNLYKWYRKLNKSKILTNYGPINSEFEKKLSEFANTKYCVTTCNGTIGLISLINTLDRKKGEIITTPYSFVATSNAIIKSGYKAVFVDTDKDTGNISPINVKKAITDNTVAILAVPIYGQWPDDDELREICEEKKIKLFYDSAHGFGVKKNNESLLSLGDASVTSFHATKTLHTFEGGAVFTNCEKTYKELKLYLNFGFSGEDFVDVIGVNGKMSEIHAAIGIDELNSYNKNLKRRKIIFDLYVQKLPKSITQIANSMCSINSNYGYFPIRVSESTNNVTRDYLYDYLKSKNIFVRKYFYPLINQYQAYKKNRSFWREPFECLNAKKISEEILCLPIYSELRKKDCLKICDHINSII